MLDCEKGRGVVESERGKGCCEVRKMGGVLLKGEGCCNILSLEFNSRLELKSNLKVNELKSKFPHLYIAHKIA